MNYIKVCSGCGKEDATVHRHMFDGLCAECTTKALYDSTFQAHAQSQNETLKRLCGWE